jgi:hypothetical protein
MAIHRGTSAVCTPRQTGRSTSLCTSFCTSLCTSFRTPLRIRLRSRLHTSLDISVHAHLRCTSLRISHYNRLRSPRRNRRRTCRSTSMGTPSRRSGFRRSSYRPSLGRTSHVATRPVGIRSTTLRGCKGGRGRQRGRTMAWCGVRSTTRTRARDASKRRGPYFRFISLGTSHVASRRKGVGVYITTLRG